MLDNYRDLIDELLEAPTVVRGALDRSQDAESVSTLVAMLTTRDDALTKRLRRVMDHPDDLVDDFPVAPVDQSQGTAAAFDTARGELVSLLMNLTLKDWARPVRFASGGESDVAQEIEAHVEFGETMLDRIVVAASGNS
ncbi:MAG: hypothetical protein ACKOCK_03620 [Chloroflexota bacterium]